MMMMVIMMIMMMMLAMLMMTMSRMSARTGVNCSVSMLEERSTLYSGENLPNMYSGENLIKLHIWWGQWWTGQHKNMKTFSGETLTDFRKPNLPSWWVTLAMLIQITDENTNTNMVTIQIQTWLCVMWTYARIVVS